MFEQPLVKIDGYYLNVNAIALVQPEKDGGIRLVMNVYRDGKPFALAFKGERAAKILRAIQPLVGLAVDTSEKIN